MKVTVLPSVLLPGFCSLFANLSAIFFARLVGRHLALAQKTLALPDRL